MRMDAVEELAPAKLNLSLDVLGAMSDGYHEMRMVMQSASLCDLVRVELCGGGEISLRTNFGFLPRDGRNLACQAAKAFFEAAGMAEQGASITLCKRIPVGAGLGGGSTDAAAVLRALNRLTGAGLSRAELETLGGKLGSDVPFCVSGGAALAAGRGELLTPIAPLPDCGIVICKPRFSIRTPELFRRIDARRSRIRPDTEGLVAAMARGDLPGAARRMFNVFEDVLPKKCAEVGVIKHRLLDAGALGAVMTGTGSAVVGVFDSREAAAAAAAELGQSYQECFTASPAGVAV